MQGVAPLSGCGPDRERASELGSMKERKREREKRERERER